MYQNAAFNKYLHTPSLKTKEAAGASHFSNSHRFTPTKTIFSLFY